jgi:hypothetical protein
MPATARLDAATRTDLIVRLRSIEGQARGVQRMLDEDRNCQEMLDQLAVLQAATDSRHIPTRSPVPIGTLAIVRRIRSRAPVFP